ncbi:biotin--[acetyl-CoA-carboxylase] ligase, partial [Micromonospora sp. PSH25]|nr:biotin--[acetyl-CoA-carboxylase] ligase [Micromonospora foliorum]
MSGSPYTDLDRPPLSAARLRRALILPNGPWARLELRAETGSTNADVAEAARADEPEGLVVVAERQTAG